MIKHFKWKHYQSDIIILCVRWSLKYPLSYRNLQDMMEERGLFIHHTTIYRWVNEYSPTINRKLRKYLKKTSDSWRVDETYLKVKGEWTYLYRAVDQNGSTIDFWLSRKRDKKAAKKFFRKVYDFHITLIQGLLLLINMLQLLPLLRKKLKMNA